MYLMGDHQLVCYPSSGLLLKGKLLLQHYNFFSLLRSFPCFAVHSSSAHEGKIMISERFQQQ